MDRRTFLAASTALAAQPLLAQTKGATSIPASPAGPPVARRGTDATTMWGLTVPDPYRWLRDPGYPDVKDKEILAWLEAENAWFEANMGPMSMLEEALFQQMKGRIKEDDESVPYADGEFLYWWKFEPGAQYRNWYRRPRAGGEARLILSETVEAKGRDYFRLGAFAVSPDGRLLAWSFDGDGDERFELRIRDLATGKDIATVAPDSLGDVAWAADSRALVWAQASAEWRPDRARLHQLGTAPGNDPILHQETSNRWVSVARTQDRRFILISTSESAANDVRLVDAARPLGGVRLVRPFQPNVRYSVDSGGGPLVILTNDTHVNFRIATAPVDAPDRWETLIPGYPSHPFRPESDRHEAGLAHT